MTTPDDDMFGDSVYADGDDAAEYLDAAETLTGETLTPEDLDAPLDQGYSPPERRPASTRYGITVDEQRDGETLDQRLAQEEPESFAAGTPEDPRAGRLVGSDPSDLFAEDVGIDGGAAAAEEAAVHIRDE